MACSNALPQGRNPLVQERLPLRHQVGPDRSLGHQRCPGGNALIHKRAPELRRIGRFGLAHGLRPRFRPRLDLLLPKVKQRVGARLLRHPSHLIGVQARESPSGPSPV
jgi:hypothetical protein